MLPSSALWICIIRYLSLRKNQLKKANTILILSVIVYIFALTQRSYCTNNDCGELGSGLAIVLSGGLGFFLCKACFTWLSNPLLLLAWITFKWNTKVSFSLNLISLIIASSFLCFEEIIVNEAGTYGEITGYAIGYWAWLLSIFILLLGNSINLKKKQEYKHE